MNRQQSLGGGGAHGFSQLKGKNVWVEIPTDKGITSEVEQQGILMNAAINT